MGASYWGLILYCRGLGSKPSILRCRFQKFRSTTSISPTQWLMNLNMDLENEFKVSLKFQSFSGSMLPLFWFGNSHPVENMLTNVDHGQFTSSRCIFQCNFGGFHYYGSEHLPAVPTRKDTMYCLIQKVAVWIACLPLRTTKSFSTNSKYLMGETSHEQKAYFDGFPARQTMAKWRLWNITCTILMWTWQHFKGRIKRFFSSKVEDRVIVVSRMLLYSSSFGRNIIYIIYIYIYIFGPFYKRTSQQIWTQNYIYIYIEVYRSETTAILVLDESNCLNNHGKTHIQKFHRSILKGWYASCLTPKEPFKRGYDMIYPINIHYINPKVYMGLIIKGPPSQGFFPPFSLWHHFNSSESEDAEIFLLLANDQQEAEADERIRFGLCALVFDFLANVQEISNRTHWTDP